jgi:hypothetical protein
MALRKDLKSEIPVISNFSVFSTGL